MKFKNFIIEMIETFAVSIVVLIAIYSSIAMPEMVYGSSMEPNFYTGDRIIVDRFTKFLKPSFERGEIVVLRPTDTTKHLIKRVIGVPGDIIKIFECKVYISKDGEKFVLNEYYLPKEVCTKGGTQLIEGRSMKIEENQYAVLGDNRSVSLDSRNLGLVNKNDIIGRVALVFWPFDRLGFTKQP